VTENKEVESKQEILINHWSVAIELTKVTLHVLRESTYNTKYRQVATSFGE
jgi:hypothetical protein